MGSAKRTFILEKVKVGGIARLRRAVRVDVAEEIDYARNAASSV